MTRWPVVRLDTFCVTGSGGTPPRDKRARYYDGGTIPWVKSGELRESLILDTSERVTPAALAETSIKLVPSGAILLAMYGATIGRLGVLGVPATTNQAICHIVPDPKAADTRYIFHALRSQLDLLVNRGAGGAQPNISQAIVRAIHIPVPPIREQRRIANILDQADAVTIERERNLEVLDRLTRSIFLDMFGDPEEDGCQWTYMTLDEVVEETKLGLVRNASEIGDDFEYGYIRMNAISRGGELDLTNQGKTDATEAEVASYRLRSGDFLFNTRNSKSLVGKTALFSDSGIWLFNNNIMRIRFRSSVIPEFIDALFQTQFVRRQLGTRISGTTSVFAIYWKDLRTVRIPIPPHALQKEFSRRLVDVDTIRQLQAQARRLSVELFASIQYLAFRGEL